MKQSKRIGILICDRYRSCAAGKCLRAMREAVGAFDRYAPGEAELVGITTCGGCPGGNVEYAPEELKKNGAEVIHLATGLVVGYPPCPYITHFRTFIQAKYGLEVVVGTHPIPESYCATHAELGSWQDPTWEELLGPTLCDRNTRLTYD
jgi:predicted metal-binding protein